MSELSTSSFVEVGDKRVHYELEGPDDAEAIVFVGGTGVSGDVWRLYQVPALRDRYRCVTFDLRGTGRSSAAPDPCTVGALAEDTVDVVEHLALEGAHFVGISLGGAIIQEVALARPDLVRSAVLISTWSSMSREHHLRRWFEARRAALREGASETFRAFAFWMWAPSVIDDEPELVDDLEHHFAAWSAGSSVEGYIAHFEADLGHETLDRLPGIVCPTLVLYGDEDLITLPTYNRRIAAAIPGAQARMVRRAGHFAWVERGAEVTEMIDEFLGSLTREGPSD